MKILYDHQIYVWEKFGGISRYHNELMKMKSDYVQIDKIDPALVPEKLIQPPANLFFRGVKYIKKRAGMIREGGHNLNLPPAVIQKVAANDYDIFHPTYFSPYFLEYCHKPFVLTVYDMIQELYKECFYHFDQLSRDKRLLCEKASHILAISDKTKQDLIEVFRVPESKITTVHLASTFNQVAPKKPAGLEGVEEYILFVGGRTVYKNFYFTIIAFAEILRSNPKLKLLCTGKPFDAYEKRFLAEYKVENQVYHVYLKGDDELAWVYTNALFFTFSSLYEGFGFPLLEAFACNCPVISSNGGSLPEVAGDAAIYFNPKSLKEMQQAAHTVMYDTEVRAQIIAKGKERLKLFSWEKCRQETYEVYKKVAGK